MIKSYFERPVPNPDPFWKFKSLNEDGIDYLHPERPPELLNTFGAQQNSTEQILKRQREYEERIKKMQPFDYKRAPPSL